MIILDEKNMERIVGGLSMAEYAILYAAFPKVMEHMPSLNKSGPALAHAGTQVLIHTGQ